MGIFITNDCQMPSGPREAICDSSGYCKGNLTDPPKILSSAWMGTE